MEKVYIAGPMSGVPQFNIPAFDAAAADLRQRGYFVVSPAELDDPAIREECLQSPDGAPTLKTSNGATWGTFLARDVIIVADKVDGVVLLDGWLKSRGARLEAFVGLLCNKTFLRYFTRPSGHPGELVPVTQDSVRNLLREYMP
jgi:uncharacterized protein DUF4406